MPSQTVAAPRSPQASGAVTSSQTGATTSATASSSSVVSRKKVDSDQILNESAIRYNDFLLDYCQTSMSALSGSAAGILGLTGYVNGLVFYFVCSMILSIGIYFYIGHNTKKYFLSKQTIFTGTLWSGIQTYLLFWTFLYGMVHVY
jgi:hypothetical protein